MGSFIGHETFSIRVLYQSLLVGASTKHKDHVSEYDKVPFVLYCSIQINSNSLRGLSLKCSDKVLLEDKYFFQLLRDAWRAQKLIDKVKIWFMPTGWRPKDVLENYPNNKVVIFNRWGVKVYGTAGYQNDWDGTYNNNMSTTSSSNLPVGTYFHVLDLNGNGSDVRKGYVYITRMNDE